PPAVTDTREHRQRTEPCGKLVWKEDRVLGEVDLAFGVSPEPGLPTDAPRVAAETAPRSPRATITEQLTAHHHDVWLHAAQRFDVEPEVVERAGSEVLDHDVARRDELEHQRVSFRRPQVDAETALVAVDRDELRRHVRRAAEHAALIRERPALHPDDVGAEVAQELSRLRSRHD